MFFRVKLIHQFALITLLAVLVVMGLVVVAIQDRAAVRDIFEEQRDLLDVKNALTHVEYEVLQGTLQKGQASNDEHANVLVGLISRLQARQNEIASEQLHLFLQSLETYRQSKFATLTLQESIVLSKQVDVLLRDNAERLSAQRQHSIFWIAGIFGFALLFLMVVLVYQVRNARSLVARLQQLALGMRDVTTGKESQVESLPDGADEIGVLSETFKKMAKQIKTQIATIDQERKNAESANRLKSQFLANMSHEIRTPMNSCLGILQLLEETDLSDEQKKYLNVMRQSSQSLLVLIDDILDFSKIEANRLTLQKELFALNECVQSTLSMLEPQSNKKGLALTCEIQESVPKLLVGDADRLRQVLLNLLGNAIKFTLKGDVGLHILCREKDNEQVTLEFQVMDTGIGISEEDLDRLFQPFMQIDASSTREYGGTGLGLSICARLVALMGGRIWVDSKVNEGSTFYFTIQAQYFTRAQDGKSALTQNGDSLSGALETLAERVPLNILLVEDNTENRMVARQMFKKMGYEVTEAVNGLEAVELTQLCHYDLVFMDLQMPFKNGLEACQEILAQDVDVKPRVIAVTANATEKDRQKCHEVGMVGFIAKPFSLTDLRLAIERWGKVQDMKLKN